MATRSVDSARLRWPVGPAFDGPAVDVMLDLDLEQVGELFVEALLKEPVIDR